MTNHTITQQADADAKGRRSVIYSIKKPPQPQVIMNTNSDEPRSTLHSEAQININERLTSKLRLPNKLRNPKQRLTDSVEIPK